MFVVKETPAVNPHSILASWFHVSFCFRVAVRPQVSYRPNWSKVALCTLPPDMLWHSVVRLSSFLFLLMEPICVHRWRASTGFYESVRKFVCLVSSPQGN